MEVIDSLERQFGETQNSIEPCGTIASGLFGYSIFNDRMSVFTSTIGYLREIEQMPNFSPPSIDNFVKHYVSSNIGTMKNSS